MIVDNETLHDPREDRFKVMCDVCNDWRTFDDDNCPWRYMGNDEHLCDACEIAALMYAAKKAHAKPTWTKRGIAVNDQYPKTVFDSSDGQTAYIQLPFDDQAAIDRTIEKLNEGLL